MLLKRWKTYIRINNAVKGRKPWLLVDLIVHRVIWSISGVYLNCICSISEVYLMYICGYSGVYLGYIWGIYGAGFFYRYFLDVLTCASLRDGRTSTGKKAWSGVYLRYVCGISGDIWGISGVYLRYIWGVSGCIYGIYLEYMRAVNFESPKRGKIRK